jgi:hypothetical protein
MELNFNDNFLNRIKSNLDKNNLSFDDLKTFKYAGGDDGCHLNYYKILFGNKQLPMQENECLCGHPIKNNCYIVNEKNENLIVLGNCCIKRFILKNGRTCERCEQPHKTRKNNYCKSCNLTIKQEEQEKAKIEYEKASIEYEKRKKGFEKEKIRFDKNWLIIQNWMKIAYKSSENSFSQLSELLRIIECKEYLPESMRNKSKYNISKHVSYKYRMEIDPLFKMMKNKIASETRRIDASIKYKRNYRTMNP